MNRTILFLFNLITDLYILRKLIFLCKDDTNYDVVLLITKNFLERDKDKTLINELLLIQNEINVEIFIIRDNVNLYNKLNNVIKGILISASESTIKNPCPHAETYEIIKICRSNITTITIQHGFECVGFLQNLNHYFIYGNNIGFGSDIICGWIEKQYQRDLIPSSKSKYVFTGNPAYIEKTSKRSFYHKYKNLNNIEKPGIICENTSSARYRKSNLAKNEFINDFLSLANLLKEKGKTIVLRPHPSSKFKKFILYNTEKLPKNVYIENCLSHKINWNNYSYGISAPSSVILDMYISGLPVCLWRDSAKSVDNKLLTTFPVAKNPNELLSFCLSPKNNPINKHSDEINSMVKVISQKKIRENFITLFNLILY